MCFKAREGMDCNKLCGTFAVDKGIFAKEYNVIADIGSGTGKFSELLLERGAHVFAVEPNEDMRAVAEVKLKNHKKFVSINGTAEHTNLQDKSIDFVTVAQAFHWFDEVAFRKECRRILNDKGVVILIWNKFSIVERVGAAYEMLLRAECQRFKGFGGGNSNSDKIARFFNDANPKMLSCSDNILYSKELFVKRALSSSYTPNEGDHNYDSFVAKLIELFDIYQENGKIKFSMQTEAFFGRIKN